MHHRQNKATEKNTGSDGKPSDVPAIAKATV